MVTEFREHVAKTGLTIDDAGWQQDLPFIKAMIRYEIDLDLFGLATASENLAKADPQMQFALDALAEAEKPRSVLRASCHDALDSPRGALARASSFGSRPRRRRPKL